MKHFDKIKKFLATLIILATFVVPAQMSAGELAKAGAYVNAEVVKAVVEDYQAETGKAISYWKFEHFRDGKLLSSTVDHNVVTNEGHDAILDIMFHADSQVATWYVLIYEDDVTPTTATTYAVPVFTECTAYSEANRQAYVEAAASSQSITNSANKATMTINATKTIYGAALVGGGTDGNTKGDVAGGGYMYCASKFSEAKPVENGDTIKITITITQSGA